MPPGAGSDVWRAFDRGAITARVVAGRRSVRCGPMRRLDPFWLQPRTVPVRDGHDPACRYCVHGPHCHRCPPPPRSVGQLEHLHGLCPASAARRCTASSNAPATTLEISTERAHQHIAHLGLVNTFVNGTRASSAARCVGRGRRAVSGRHGRAESGAAVPVNAQPPVECACGRTGFTLKSALTCAPAGERVFLLIPTRPLLSRELEMLTSILGSVGDFLEIVIGALF